MLDHDHGLPGDHPPGAEQEAAEKKIADSDSHLLETAGGIQCVEVHLKEAGHLELDPIAQDEDLHLDLEKLAATDLEPQTADEVNEEHHLRKLEGKDL